jgi:hypothetical protein
MTFSFADPGFRTRLRAAAAAAGSTESAFVVAAVEARLAATEMQRGVSRFGDVTGTSRKRNGVSMKSP